MIRRRILHASAAATLLALSLAGCGDAKSTAAAKARPSASPSPSPSKSRDVNQVECVNLDRAYNAWEGPNAPRAAADVAGWNLGAVEYAMEDGKTFLNAVTGYNDQPSKVLASAVAEYNFELSLANFQVTTGDAVDADQTEKVATAAGKVRDAYKAIGSSTCS